MDKFTSNISFSNMVVQTIFAVVQGLILEIVSLDIQEQFLVDNLANKLLEIEVPF